MIKSSLPTNRQLYDWMVYACEINNASDLIPEIKVEWSERMTSTIGRAWVLRNSKPTKDIQLSIPLYQRATLKQQQETMVHEVCHLIAFYKYNDKGHGYWWKICMINAGFTPDIYHNVDNSDIRRNREKYSLNCKCGQEYKVTNVIFKRMTQGKKYRCRKCSSVLSNVALKLETVNGN